MILINNSGRMSMLRETEAEDPGEREVMEEWRCLNTGKEDRIRCRNQRRC